MEFDNLTSAAMSYAHMGFHIFPCRPKSKIPDARFAPHGFLDATNDRKTIASWWHECPDCNIGIRTGHESNLYVWDLDVEKDDNGVPILINGEPNRIGNMGLNDLRIKHGNGEDIHTMNIVTGTGGNQLWYSIPPDVYAKINGGMPCHIGIVDHVDLKGDGGYVVAPPSVHPVTGNKYVLGNDLTPAPMPEWMMNLWKGAEMETSPDYESSSVTIGSRPLSEDQVREISGIFAKYYGPSHGFGHNLALAFYGMMAHRGVPQKDIARIVDRIVADNGYTGLTKADISSTYKRLLHGGKIWGMSKLLHIIKEHSDKLPDVVEIKDWVSFNLADLPATICYEWANGHKICLDVPMGTFYTQTTVYDSKGNDHEKVEPVVQVPIKMNGVVLDGDVPKFDTVFYGKRYVADINTLMSRISVDQRTSRVHSEMIMMFLVNYLNDHVADAKIYHADPIWIDTENIMHIEWLDDSHNIVAWPSFDIKDLLTTLNELWKITTNPDAFVRLMGWSLFAPYSYYSRLKRIPVPFKALSGITESAKTEMAMLFVSEGYNQESGSVLIGENQIETKFTEMEQLSRSVLPAVFDDLSVQYLQKRESFFKNIYLGTKAGARGRADQSVNEYPNKRNFVLTINDEMQISRAQIGRYDVELFTKEHSERQNIAEYTRLKAKLPNGFMLALNREIFNGKRFDEIIKDMRGGIKQRGEWNQQIIKYCINEINTLCVKYGIPPFTCNGHREGTGLDHFTMVCEFLMEQYHRHMVARESGHAMFTEVGDTEMDVDDLGNETYVIWFTTTAFRKITLKLRLPYETVKDFMNSYTIREDVQILQPELKNHKMLSKTPRRGYALTYKLMPDASPPNTFIKKILENNE